MTKDYILFIHGVNTRQKPDDPNYADEIFENIKFDIKQIAPSLYIELKKAALYWGNEGQKVQNDLCNDFEESKVFKDFWFKDFRKKQLLQFAGDAAIYISRSLGSEIVKKLKKDAEQYLKGYKKGDRLHLVTHSWGTVILFDVLFADRWDDDKVPGCSDVQSIRNFLFGLGPNKNEGVYLSSIHTMGSPIALFSLISRKGSTHDFSPKLKEFLKYHYEHVRNGQKLPWQNFIHPGDPVAWPLEQTISRIMCEFDKKLLPDVTDIVIPQNAGIGDFVTQFFNQELLALFNGGNAHSSYWQSQTVSQKIAKSIVNTARRGGATQYGSVKVTDHVH